MASGIKAYPFDVIEPKWQAYWADKKTFRSPDPGEKGAEKPKYYVLDMFPYPSGSGLHVGHLEGYTATDIVARYKRMRGFNVLHPMGWDAFGLPAEQHAIETNTHPSKTTAENVANFKRQIQRMGFSYDWEREVNTTDSHYYKWTQWIFMKLFERGLAYESEMPVNWCPELGTVLANEEVIDGKSERGGHPVIRKPMRQWVLKITAYAERLLKDLDLLDWTESIKEMQRNWIGKSEGAEVDFQTEAGTIRVYTTRPDTLFGATYMVLSPEHPLVSQITTSAQKSAVEKYVTSSAKKSDLDRTDLAKEKTGVFTGGYAVNPVNQQKIPVWIADYVLMSYGTGAIMAVPAHDERDFEFAVKFKLPIVEVIRQTAPAVSGTIKTAFTGVGTCINSTTPDKSFSIDGMDSDKAKEKITGWLESKKIGKKSVQYKLRDWLFSRQRYWGEPIPIIHCVKCSKVLVPESDLPVLLPDFFDFRPTGDGQPPLERASFEWKNPKCPKCGGENTFRETNTMPQWAGSCWYYLRYIDPKNPAALIDSKKEKYWMNVDLYIGGAEHAVLHLLYARFWHKVLFDLGIVSTPEPFQKLINQGMILGEDSQKMSKSRGNVVNPDDIVKIYGADSIRLYEMFMGPLEMTKPWSDSGVEGVYRFLARVWRLFVTVKEGTGSENLSPSLNPKIVNRKPSPQELKRLHTAIKKATDDLENLRFNTAISAFMIFVNETLKDEDYSREILEKFILLLAPFAPHISEELWNMMGNKETLAYAEWPVYNEAFLTESEIEMAVIVNGKVRAKMVVPADIKEDALREMAVKDERVSKWLDNGKYKKVIIVPGRVVNIVA